MLYLRVAVLDLTAGRALLQLRGAAPSSWESGLSTVVAALEAGLPRVLGIHSQARGSWAQ